MKKTIVIIIVALSLCSATLVSAQHKEQNKKTKTQKKETETEGDIRRQYLETKTLLDGAQYNLRITEGTLKVKESMLNDAKQESTARSKSVDSLKAELEKRDQLIKSQEVFLGEKESVIDSISHPSQNGQGDLSLPLTDYAKCKSDSLCTESLLEELINLPEEKLSSGDAESLKKIIHFNEIFDRLDARTTARYLKSLQDQLGLMSKKSYRHKRSLYVTIIPHLEQRRADILSTRSEWSKYGKNKKDVERIFGMK